MAVIIPFGGHQFQCAVRRKWLVVLRDLISLWQIGVEVILSREDRFILDLKTKGERGFRAKNDSIPV